MSQIILIYSLEIYSTLMTDNFLEWGIYQFGTMKSNSFTFSEDKKVEMNLRNLHKELSQMTLL
jgi:hypothetical protein